VLGVVMNSATANPTFPRVELDAPLPDPNRPTVFVSLHVGAMAALPAVLAQLPNEVVALHRMDWRLPDNVVGVHVERTDTARAKGFYRALEALHRGGHVCMPIEGRSVPVSLFGRPFRLSRGPFALARLTGAPIVPLLGRWQGGRARVFVGQPTAGLDEQAMALAVAREIELYLSAHPSEVTDYMIARLIDGQQPLPDL
jgi:lauroyl/myristoyl acyltransferase